MSKILIDEATVKLALEALERVDAIERGMVTTSRHHYQAKEDTTKAITALREALAEQPAQQEPVKQVTIADAPSCLNTHDKAMWVLGWNECAEAAPAQHKPLRPIVDEGLTAEQRLLFKYGWKSAEAAHNIRENT